MSVTGRVGTCDSDEDPGLRSKQGEGSEEKLSSYFHQIRMSP